MHSMNAVIAVTFGAFKNSMNVNTVFFKLGAFMNFMNANYVCFKSGAFMNSMNAIISVKLGAFMDSISSHWEPS